ANASLYVNSRMLFSLARGGYAPARFGRLTHSVAPLLALLASCCGIILALISDRWAPQSAYVSLLGAALFGVMLVWLVTLSAHIGFRRKLSPAQLSALFYAAARPGMAFCGRDCDRAGLPGRNLVLLPSDPRQRRHLRGGAHPLLPGHEEILGGHYNVEAMSDDLLRYRPEFPILERTTYLISNSLGAMPRGVYDALHGYADTWATRGVRAWEERWWMLAAQVGDQIGALMNAPRGSVATFQNVTTCQAVVASCFDFSGKRNKVVYSDLNFPSVMYFWEAQRSRGARVHMVKTDDGIHVPTERLLEAIDENTLLVPVSHVIFRSAFINDARAIVERAHKVGAHVMLDTFQSLGTVPFDVQQLQVDFVCGGVLKWLCGGPGTSYLYVRPDLGRKPQPTYTGWIAHENPFAFEVGAIRYSEPPYKFMN